MKKFIIGMCFVVGSTVVCLAEQPVCTGDRHYDGVACCPVVDPPGKCDDGTPCTCPTTDANKCPDGTNCHCDASITTTTSTTTTTTLPVVCPPVECVCEGNQPTVTVVMPCPEIKFPNYVFCRVVRKSHRHPTGVKCRTPKNPHSLWVPATDSVDGAQVG